MLRLFLLANAVSCAGFGLLFLIFPTKSAAFIGTPPIALVGLTGAVLAINALLLAMTAWRWRDNVTLIWFFVLGDIGWVVATVLLLGLGLWIQGPAATTLAALVAALVGALGYGQYRFGIQIRSGGTHLA